MIVHGVKWCKKIRQMSMYNGHIHSNIDRVQYIKTILKLRGLLEIKLFFTLTSYIHDIANLTNAAKLDHSLVITYPSKLLTKIENKINSNDTIFIQFLPLISYKIQWKINTFKSRKHNKLRF